MTQYDQSPWPVKDVSSESLVSQLILRWSFGKSIPLTIWATDRLYRHRRLGDVTCVPRMVPVARSIRVLSGQGLPKS